MVEKSDRQQALNYFENFSGRLDELPKDTIKQLFRLSNLAVEQYTSSGNLIDAEYAGSYGEIFGAELFRRRGVA